MNNITIINKLNKTFKYFNNYDHLNEINSIKMRNSKIKLSDLIYFAFKYSKKNITKQEIVNCLNLKNKKNISYTCYVRKLKNIKIIYFKKLLIELIKLSNDCGKKNNKYIYNVKEVLLYSLSTGNTDNRCGGCGNIKELKKRILFGKLMQMNLEKFY